MASIHGTNFDDLLVESVTIDESNLEREYVRLPSDMAYWCSKLAEAEGAFLRAKAKLRETEAKAWTDVAERASETKVKFTQKDFEAWAQSDLRVVAAGEELSYALEKVKRLKGFVEAVSSKRDMLMQLGATRRQELKVIG